ncbi:MAG: phage tail sheath C-terminal domain-containing protein [Rhodothermales bacterium]|nr:phage tail sheath C-terminal domain-containing protein [Rhodothermales bacterium]
MPVTPTYPGVYIEEVPSGVRTITGVATSVAAFIGYFSRGPMNEAVRVFSFGDFEREFGGLRADSEASYALQQFFLNGGGQAWVVRTAYTDPLNTGTGTTAQAAAVVLEDSADGSPTEVLVVSARDEGAWGNALRIEVDYHVADPTDAAAPFNLTVTEVGEVNGRTQALNTETFRNLVFDPDSAQYVVDVVNAGSRLVEVALPDPTTPPAAAARPAHSGTLSAALDVASLSGTDTMDVSLDGGADTYTVSVDLDPVSTAAGLAAALQRAIRDVTPTAPDDFSGAAVRVVGSASTAQYLEATAGTDAPEARLVFADDGGGGTLASTLGLDDAGRTNVQQYALGAATAVGAQALPSGSQQQGRDGDRPGALDLIGEADPKTGLHALLDVDLFNLLSIPRTMTLGDTEAAQVAAAALAFCEAERAFYLLDVPQPTNPRDEVEEVTGWLDDHATLRHRNAALYFPRPEVADPLNDFRLRPVAPSGTMAGVYARTDGERGVWKAPAGTEAVLRGAQRLEYKLTDAENGVVNPLGINALRTLPVFGTVAWGARTLVGADQLASEWKYVPVRRLALFLEESLFRGTQWVVFEPNDEKLWAQIRLNVGVFMHNLFRQGAFQGTTPREAYFVKCDAETNPQADIDRGIVNVVVGFAPLKPAEFVIIKIQQIAGQLEA